jgi:hypothetical protein
MDHLADDLATLTAHLELKTPSMSSLPSLRTAGRWGVHIAPTRLRSTREEARTALSRSNITGRKGAPRASQKLLPSSSSGSPTLIVTYGGAALVLKRTTTSIPIVFAIALDPLGAGLVQNLSRPGRERYGLVDPTDRYERQAARGFARNSPWPASARDHV